MGLCRGDFNRPNLHASFFVFLGGQGCPLLQKIFLIQIILNLSNSAKKISKENLNQNGGDRKNNYRKK